MKIEIHNSASYIILLKISILIINKKEEVQIDEKRK